MPTSGSSSTSCSATKRSLSGRTRPNHSSRMTAESGGGHEDVLVVIGESRSAPDGGAMSVGQIERELARLRMNEDGTLGARASVLNLMVVTDERFAQDVAPSISEISAHDPSRAILMIADLNEEE